MSDGKLPPLSFYTRREKTLMGLKFQKSVYLPKRSSRPPLNHSVYFHGIQNNAFLPDDISRTKSQKLNKSYRSARESVHQKYNLSSGLGNVPNTSMGGTKKHFSVHPQNLLYRNIPDGIALRRDNNKLIMKVKTPTKLKKLQPPPVTKYAQLHKLGLDENLNRHSSMSPRDVTFSGTPRVDPFKRSEEGLLETGKITRRNVTQTFRLDSSAKNCVYPVQFQPDGLPSKHDVEEAAPRGKVSDQNNGRKTSRPNQVKTLDDQSNKGENTAVSKVELGMELKGIIPNVTKSKHENRDLYPIFDWTQQKREDDMRVRFLDPVLKDFDNNSDHMGHKPFLSDLNRLKLRQSYDDIYRFAPDKMNIELNWKLIKEYRTRVRKQCRGAPRLPSPSFSPLLNPPPTAMEFNIADLETLLEQDRPPSSAHMVSTSAPICDTSMYTPNAELDNFAPAISGTACKPVSTALKLATKNKFPETKLTTGPSDYELSRRNGDAASDIHVEDIKGECCESDNEEVQEKQQRDQKETNADNDQISSTSSPEKHPIQVVIKVIPSIVEDLASATEDNGVDSAENGVSSTVLESRTISKKPSSALLAVPHIDVAFEGRFPDKDRKVHSSSHGTVIGSSVVRSKVTSSSHSAIIVPTGEDHADDKTCEECKQTPRSSAVNLSRKHVPNKNIVFISPAVENVDDTPIQKSQK